MGDMSVLTDPKSGAQEKRHKRSLRSDREPRVGKGIEAGTEKGSSSQQAPCP